MNHPVPQGDTASRRSAPRSRFEEDVLAGLAARRKAIPSKYFYDERGSRLFDEICELPEYYPTKTEVRILSEKAVEMAGLIGPTARVVELGSGSSLKTRLLLDALERPAVYVPMDISADYLIAVARDLAESYPLLDVLPLAQDFMVPYRLPRTERHFETTVAFFPGSTIGNLPPLSARTLLQGIRTSCGDASALLIGVDLRKDPAVLHRAYNDGKDVTASFNKNLLTRCNRELGADFDPSKFSHYAFYEPTEGRIEMHLVSRERQSVRMSGRTFHFDQGESILTEYSYKYTMDAFRSLAAEAGYETRKVWTDPKNFFSVHYLTSR